MSNRTSIQSFLHKKVKLCASSSHLDVLTKPTVFVMTKQKGRDIKPSGGGMTLCFLGKTPRCLCYTRDESERAIQN